MGVIDFANGAGLGPQYSVLSTRSSFLQGLKPRLSWLWTARMSRALPKTYL
jgi:hypothetical protein